MIRFFDFVLSLIGIVILSPAFLILGLWIFINSKGQIFYKQTRIGHLGVDFNLYKFRSMYNDSDRGGLLTIGEKDPRITVPGYYLRKYKLDELPQLLNVLKGDMSLVGPRPEVRKYVELYTESQKKIILSIKPGLTDYASILFRNENELLAQSLNPEESYTQVIIYEKIKINMKYIQNRSVFQYFKIIFLTVKSITK